jgi:hypothetical protein
LADVFISYARAERADAERIAARLTGLGLSVFLDVDGLDGGDMFSDKLDREVKTSGAVLGLWSPLALSRPWVQIECDIGKRRGVLVPVAIRPFRDMDVPAPFWNIQFVDFTDLTDSPDDANWIKLVKSLARTLQRPELLQREISGPRHDASARDDLHGELERLRAELESMRSTVAQGRPVSPDEASAVSQIPNSAPNATLLQARAPAAGAAAARQAKPAGRMNAPLVGAGAVLFLAAFAVMELWLVGPLVDVFSSLAVPLPGTPGLRLESGDVFPYLVGVNDLLAFALVVFGGTVLASGLSGIGLSRGASKFAGPVAAACALVALVVAYVSGMFIHPANVGPVPFHAVNALQVSAQLLASALLVRLVA